MLYIEPKLHKRIVLTDTENGKYSIITTFWRNGRLVFGISAPASINIKHIEPPENGIDHNSLKREDQYNGKEINQKIN